MKGAALATVLGADGYSARFVGNATLLQPNDPPSPDRVPAIAAPWPRVPKDGGPLFASGSTPSLGREVK
jgi:hypothetical protein